MGKIYNDGKDKNVAGYVVYLKSATGRYFYDYDAASGVYSNPVDAADALKLFAAGVLVYADSTYTRISSYADFLAGCTDPLAGLAIDFDIADSVDLLGKKASDLQRGVHLVGDVIEGTLIYQTDYTGFSGDPAEQKGCYLAFHCAVPGVEGVTLKVNNTTLDEDGIMILLMGKFKPIIVEASKSGCETITKTYYPDKLVRTA